MSDEDKTASLFTRTVPDVRAYFPVGYPFDISSGRYLPGENGRMILSGGLMATTGICGRGNTFKSSLLNYFMFRVLGRYSNSGATAHLYDNDVNVIPSRLIELYNEFGFDGDPIEDGRFVVTDKSNYFGDEWFDLTKKTLKSREKGVKARLTPFIGRDGKNISFKPPCIYSVDTFTAFTTEDTADKQDNLLGSSERNMIAMRGGNVKAQMMDELPALLGRYNGQMIMTAQLTDAYSLDPRSPPAKKLAYLKANIKFTGIPNNFTANTNNLWLVVSTSPCINDTDKLPEYPSANDSYNKKDTDLTVLEVMQLRGKSGPTGISYPVIISQSEGVMEGLSQWQYLRDNQTDEKKPYGVNGTPHGYYLELYPDVKVTRKTVRDTIDRDPMFRRALQITEEMHEIEYVMKMFDRNLITTPALLHKNLKEMGYDWNDLLNTIGYFKFKDDKGGPNELSTADLLRMNAGLYRPYWMPKLK